MCEEVDTPATQVPQAYESCFILLTLFATLVFLIPLVFVMPRSKAMLANLLSGQPTPVIIRDAVGSPSAAFGFTYSTP